MPGMTAATTTPLQSKFGPIVAAPQAPCAFSCGAGAQPFEATRCLRRGEPGSQPLRSRGSEGPRGQAPGGDRVAVVGADCEETATV